MITIVSDTLRAALIATVDCISTDVTRHALNSLLLTSDGTTFTVVATDGHRLARYRVPAVNCCEGGAFSILIPRDTVVTLVKALKKVMALVELDVAHCSAAIPGVATFQWKNVDAQFPPWEQVIPSYDDTRPGLRWIGFNPLYLADAGKAFAALHHKKSPVVDVRFGATELDPIMVAADRVPELLVIVMPAAVESVGGSKTFGYPAVRADLKAEVRKTRAA